MMIPIKPEIRKSGIQSECLGTFDTFDDIELGSNSFPVKKDFLSTTPGPLKNFGITNGTPSEG